MLVTESELQQGYLQPFSPKEKEVDESSMLETLGASFRQENLVGSAFFGKPYLEPFEDQSRKQDPEYNVEERVEERGLGDYLDRFDKVFNDFEFEQKAQQIENELADREVIANAGAAGFVSQFLAAAVDPINFVPIGGQIFKGAKGTRTILQASIDTARVAAPSIALQESLLNATQETRTLKESVVNVTAGTFLAAGIGGSVAALSKSITGKSFGEITAKFEEELVNTNPELRDAETNLYRSFVDGDSLGAARAFETTLEQETIAPAFGIERATKGLNPVLRLAQSPIKAVREFSQELIDQPIYFNKNFEGIATPQSIENLRFEQDIRAADIRQNFAKFYKEHKRAAKKAGTKSLTGQEFSEAVSYAMRNDDVGADNSITGLAKHLRKNIIDPLKEKAIELDLLPEDIQVSTASSYLTRMTSKAKILQQPNEFRNIVREWANDKIGQISRATQEDFARRIETERNKLRRFQTDKERIAEQEIRVLDARINEIKSLHSQRLKQRIRATDTQLRQTAQGTKAFDNLTAKRNDLQAQLEFGPETVQFQKLTDRRNAFKREAKIKTATKESDEIEQKIFELEKDRDLQLEGLREDPDYVENIVDDMFNTLTGTDRQPLMFELRVATHGPLKDRTWDIQDNVIQDFLENDVEFLANYYNRSMTGQLLLQERFGTTSFDQAVKPIIDAKDDFARDLPNTEMRKVNQEFKRNLADLKMLWDLTNGTYKSARDYDSMFVKGAQFARTYNYMRLLGQVTISSMADVGNVVMVNGMKNIFGDLLIPTIRNIKGFKPLRQELKDAAIGYESVLNSRIQNLMEIGDPTGRGTVFTRFLNNAGTIFTKTTGITYWNDMMKTASGMMSQMRILRNSENFAKGAKLGKAEDAYMRWLGFSDSDMREIATQTRAHGEKINGVTLSGARNWTNEQIGRKYRAALNKVVNSTIVTKGLGDVPAIANTELGKTWLQFQNFSLAAHQRITINGAQRLRRGDMNALNGIVALITSGMFVAYLKAEDFREGSTKDWSTDKWIMEGIDRSGLLPAIMIFNNPWEKIGLPGLGTAVTNLTGNEMQPLTRYAARGVVSSVLGPTVGSVEDATMAIHSITSGNANANDIHRLRKLLPFQNTLIIKDLLDQIDPKVQERNP